MPRVHGLDSDPRRRPHHRSGGGGGGSGGGGSIFSLATPFQSARGTAANNGPRTAAATSHAAEEEDMEVRGIQTQAAVEEAAAPGGSRPPGDDGRGALATRTATVASAAESRAAAEGSHGAFDDEMKMGDGGGDDSDATTLDDSEDLLADGSQDVNGGGRSKSNDMSSNRTNGKSRSNPKGSSNNKQTIHPTALLSPISPATRTLDRLSHFGSQEGGAELCLHLLKTAGGDDEGSDDEEEEGESDDQGKGSSDDGGEGSRAALAARGNGKEGEKSGGAPSFQLANDNDHNNTSKEQCLQELKAYFMITQNAAAIAKTSDLQPPSVPFCRRCTAAPAAVTQLSQSSAASLPLPHHGLCPRHDDFFHSGSYEILNLIVDGNLLGCDACVCQFERGRPNRALEHGRGCQRGRKKGTSGRKKGSGGATGKGTAGEPMPKAAGAPPPSSPMPGWTSAGTRSRPSPSQLTPPPPGGGRSASNTAANNSGKNPAERQGPFEPGTLVFVQDRQWPGMNDSGGVARVLKVHDPKEGGEGGTTERTYDVRYVVENRNGRGIAERHLSLHAECASPSKKGPERDVPEGTEEESGKADAGADDGANDADGRAADPAAAADDAGTPPTPEVDEDGRPLSAYEKKRRRNIRRNEARLRRLGLLDRPRPPVQNRRRKEKKRQQPREEVERRVQPKRHGKPASEEGEGGKPKADAGSATASGRQEKEPTRVVSLEDAAGLGCRKCIDELETGTKNRGKSHDASCPRRRKGAAAPKGVDKGRPQNQLTPTNVHQQLQPSSKGAARRVPTIVDAAKAGCRKCTKEWQTTEEDPTANHDVCCPRVGKRPPSAKSRRASKEEATPRPVPRAPRPTPSPVPPKNAHAAPKPPARPPPPLPSWMADFLAESDRNDQLDRVPRGSKWMPCPNPWGKLGHEEGDFVIISPFQSESEGDLLSIYHRGPNGGVPKRFVANPLEEGSPYHATHRGPDRGGYSVLCLRRDRVGLRPWGFTARMHEFGGACLVNGVEPLSPAEAAEDISGWIGKKDASSGLKLNDMIVAVNGKSVGSMTMPELQIELDVCGPQLMLVVSRFDVHESVARGSSTTLEDLAMDWHDIGPGAPRKRKRVSFESEPSCERYEPEGQLALQDEHEREDDHIDEVENEGSAFRAYSDGAAESGSKQTARGEEVVVSALKATPNPMEQPSMHKPGPKKTAADGAASGCKKCIRELRTGTKEKSKHDMNCPRKTGPKPSTSLSEAAASGCKKCARELRTGTKDATKHGVHCPRKPGPKPSLSEAINSGCRKCIRELRTGSKDANPHDMNCPRKTGFEASKKAKAGTDKHGTESDVGFGSESQGDAKASRTTFETEDAVKLKEKRRLSESGQKQKRAKPLSRYQKQLEELSDDGSDLLPKKADLEDEQSCGSAEEEYNADGDENPWLGCVCGRTHPHPIKVFWVQCNDCDAWHEVAEDCVGFDEEAAKALEKWFCWSCEPPVAGLGL